MQTINKTSCIASRAQGFSLIEIMVVVAIIAILAAIAIPSYQSYIIKTNRAAATACLLEQAQFMERFYTTNLRYDQDTAGVAVALPAPGGCKTDLAARYAFALAPALQTYIITATPQGPQNDPQCGILGINQTGVKTVLNGSTTPADVKNCWK